MFYSIKIEVSTNLVHWGLAVALSYARGSFVVWLFCGEIQSWFSSRKVKIRRWKINISKGLKRFKLKLFN